jgi:peroxiredoxin
MKTLTLILSILALNLNINSQNFYASSNEVKNLDGSALNLNDALSGVEGTIMVFWEMNDPECYKNLDNLNDAWLEKLKELNVNMVAICVDRQGNSSIVKPYVSGQGWDFDVFIDTNGELKRKLGITDMPQTVLLDKNQTFRCRYAGYCSGDEFQICDKIINCLEKTGDLANL